ncbi:SpaN/EivJ family type III secretion system needle length determinant [Yersinia massiliensis]|uniref:SpaN/EivJ family type III secretion system needle length determinant n=1 Tax=Yersinia massiliensis TaxID=419257 RepID=UPI00030C2C89|nr:type III secretion system needle length determinant, SpaN/EivJ family [Yersinia massiliensis]
MVAIKQAPNSTAFDLKCDDAARVSPSKVRRGDNEPKVSFIRGEAEKQAAELLDKIKQRKKKMEEQPAPAMLIPVTIMNNMPLSTQLKLQTALLPDAEHFQAGESLSSLQSEVAVQPQTGEKTPAKPTMSDEFGREKAPIRTVAAKTDTQPYAIQQDSDVMQQDSDAMPRADLSSENRDKPTATKVFAASLSAEGQKQNEHNTSVNARQPDAAPKEVIMTSSALGRELSSSAPLAQKKGSAQGDEQPLELFTQQPAVQSSSFAEPVEIKAASRTLPEAFVTEGESKAGNRTLSYTFTQWKNSPVVTFELSVAGELTAMTTSAEVQQALQENRHLLTSDNPLRFRDDEQNKERREQQQAEQEDEA